MSIIKYFTASLIIVAALSSCKKTDTYDIVGDPEVKFFTNNIAAGNAPQNSISYAVVNIPNTAGSGMVNLSTTIPASIKFPVLATKAVDQDVTINAELDTTLVAAYNAANNTSYQSFPAGFFNTDGLVAHLTKGASSSADSLTLVPNLTVLNTLTGTAYLAPVKLTKVSNASGSITTTTKITYIVANVEQRRIKALAVAADALGTLITSRAAWTVNFTPAPTTVGSVTDASLTTFSRWTASPVIVDVNMQTTQNVTGVRLYTATSATYVPSQVEVSVSNDGINYDLVGAPLKANITYASTYNYILFYKAIAAKYIRLKLSYITSTNTQNYRLVELDVYAN